MKNTLVIGAGTTGGAVVKAFHQRVEAQSRAIERRLCTADDRLRQILLLRRAEIERDLRIRAFDIDGAAEYRLPPAPQCDGGWPTGVFSHMGLPDAAALDRMRSGEARLIQFYNPAALRGLDDPGASGGTPPNGFVAWQANSERAMAELRQDWHFLLGKQQVRANPRTDGVRVFVVLGLYGGFGTGVWRALRGALWMLGGEFGVRMDLTPIFIVPGVHSGKDRVNSNAIAYAALKAGVAEASEYFWARDYTRGIDCATNERTRVRSSIIITDINNAPNCPKVLPPQNLNALAGQVLYTLVFSPLGDLLETQLGDFTKAGAKLTPAGETCHGRAVGLSSITLNRERLYRHSSAVAGLDFLERAAREGAEDAVRQEAVAWIESLNLGFAHLPQGAAGELLRRSARGPAIDRFRSLFRDACDRLNARDVLRSGRRCRDVSLAQLGDFEGALEQQARVVAEEATTSLATAVRRMACDPGRGPAYAGHWVRVCGGCVDQVIECYREESSALQERSGEAESRAESVEDTLLTRVQSHGALWAAWNAAEIEDGANTYRRALERGAVCNLERHACAAAGYLLDAVRERLTQVWSELLGIPAALAATRETVLARKAAAAAESPDFFCPNGLELLSSKEDLEKIDQRLFTDADREAVAASVFLSVGAAKDPLPSWSDPERLLAIVDATLRSSLLARKVNLLGIWDELERFCDGDAATLGSVVRERDLQSYERVSLNPGARASVVRLAGADARCLESLKQALATNATTRDTEYIPVETGDPDRVDLLQLQFGFAISDLRHMSMFRADYLLTHRENPFERHHVYPHERLFQDPGFRPEPAGWGALAVRAALLGRLAWDDDRAEWVLLSADPDDLPTPLGARFEVFGGQLGYRLSIDIASHFGCHYMEHGPDAIRRRMSALRSGGPDGPPLAARMEPGEMQQAFQRIEAELEWWARNSATAAMEWARKQRDRLPPAAEVAA